MNGVVFILIVKFSLFLNVKKNNKKTKRVDKNARCLSTCCNIALRGLIYAMCPDD
ncbi:hypothetical protein HanXRQr2_Chr14g0624921 [Helianthus annuus]|uniref:Uncharacterized protein n=1 Tax=Helianthus annuus TaxID=4232 RepID=A0A9K3E6U6_HELAN|nr:hypothetical protein HanXRQr2_Chr14g0624921 [Helianthus annuus]